MAFTNPILAGEELNRTGIRSDNYVAGASGWRIASDGAAEFDNIGLRGNLWVPSITLNGQDLASQINALPKGCIAFINGYPVVQTTSEIQCMQVEADIVSGRYYEIFATNITTDIQTGTDSAEFKFRWTLGTPPPPVTTSSDIVTLGLRQSIFQIAVVRCMFWSGSTTRMRVALTLASLNGSNVRTWAPSGGCTLGVIDHGTAPYVHPGQGIVGSGAPTRTLKEWTITANTSKTYLGNGTHRQDQYKTTLVAGDWANGKGNQRSWFTFSSSDVSTKLDDLIGVPVEDIVIAELWLKPLEYYDYISDSGRLSLGFHNTVDNLGPDGVSEYGGGIPNVYHPTVIGYDGGWLGLKSPVPSNFLDSMRDGYLNGFMLGNTDSGADKRVVCEGVGWAGVPQLHMKYWKNT
jgi:hypothetical protein